MVGAFDIVVSRRRHNIFRKWLQMSHGRKKHAARPGLEPSNTPCGQSDHWVTEWHGRPITISPCLIRFDPESSRNHTGTDESPFAARSSNTDPHWATKWHRGGQSTRPDRDSNPGTLAYRASTLTTELPSHTVEPGYCFCHKLIRSFFDKRCYIPLIAQIWCPWRSFYIVAHGVTVLWFRNLVIGLVLWDNLIWGF